MTDRKWTKAEQAEHRAELVADLRTEGLLQVTGSLRLPKAVGFRETDGFCCLGRGCEVAAKQGVTKRNPYGDGYSTEEFAVEDESISYDNGYLPNEVREFYGFSEKNGRLRTPVTDAEGRTAFNLTDLNDALGWSFSQIADLIEQDGVVLEA